MNFKEGDRLENYTLQELLGSGTNSEVWKVSESNREAVLKIYDTKALDLRRIEAFRGEYTQMSFLSHPNIAKVNRFLIHNELSCIELPVYDMSLDIILDEKIKKAIQEGSRKDSLFREYDLVRLLHHISSALVYLKQNGIVHNDIKPDNILVNVEGDDYSFYLSDFGISTSIKRSVAEQSRQTELLGLSMHYASPEQWQGKSTYQSDVFGLGAMLYELMTGQFPSGRSDIGIGQLLADEKGIEVPEVRYTDYFYQDIVLSCMEPNPTDRPSVEELWKESKGFLDQGFWSNENTKTVRNTEYLSVNTGSQNIQKAQDLTSHETEFTPPRKRKKRRGRLWLAVLVLPLLAFSILNILLHLQLKGVDKDHETGFLMESPGFWMLPSYKSQVKDLESRKSKYVFIGKKKNDLIRVQDHDGLWGFVDYNFEPLIPVKYSEAIDFVNGVTIVREDAKCGLINNENIRIGEMKYELCTRVNELEYDLRTANGKLKKVKI